MTDTPLAGKRLRYLIGADSAGEGRADYVTEAPYGEGPARRGISIAYCNLFDQRDSYDSDTNSGDYGPYLPKTDTARDYDEGVIDPSGDGWRRNLIEQFEQCKSHGFEYIELDNPDAYSIADVIGAIELAAQYGLKVIAKNPGGMKGGSSDATAYLGHPNVYGVIVERGGGAPNYMDQLRSIAGKPYLPVWFVAFGLGRSWAKGVANTAQNFLYMGVTYSSRGEYENSSDILLPKSKL